MNSKLGRGNENNPGSFYHNSYYGGHGRQLMVTHSEELMYFPLPVKMDNTDIKLNIKHETKTYFVSFEGWMMANK